MNEGKKKSVNAHTTNLHLLLLPSLNDDDATRPPPSPPLLFSLSLSPLAARHSLGRGATPALALHRRGGGGGAGFGVGVGVGGGGVAAFVCAKHASQSEKRGRPGRLQKKVIIYKGKHGVTSFFFFFSRSLLRSTYYTT